MAVTFNGKHLTKFIRPEEYEAIYPQVELAHKQLETKTGAGNDFLVGLTCLLLMTRRSLPASRRPHRRSVPTPMCCWSPASAALSGARAVVEAVKGLYHNEVDDGLKIYFCGNTISPTALNDIIKLTKGKRFSINVISKSGTTTETAPRFPRAAQAFGGFRWRRGGQQAHLRYHRPRQGHAEAAGHRAGLADLRGSR